MWKPHQTSSAALTQGPVDAGHGATVLGTRSAWGEGAGVSPLSPWNTGGLISGPLRASSFHPTLSGPCPQIAHRPAGQVNQGQRRLGCVKGRDLQADVCGVRGGQGAFTAALRGKRLRHGGMGASQERAARGRPGGGCWQPGGREAMWMR